MTRPFAVLIGCLISAHAWGQPRPVRAAEPPPEELRARAELSTALSFRSGGVDDGRGIAVVYSGFPALPSPTFLHFAGAYFPQRWPVGLTVHTRFDTFRLEGRALDDAAVNARLNSLWIGAGAARGFELPLRSYLELSAGLEGGGFAIATLQGTGVRVERVGYLGLTLGALLQIPVVDPWSAVLKVGLLPFSAGSVAGVSSNVQRFDAAVQVNYGKFRLANFNGSFFGEYEFSRQVSNGGTATADYFAHRNSHRLGAGVRFLLPERLGPPPPPTGPGRLRGRLFFEENQRPANGVDIFVNDQQVTRTTSDGTFTASSVGPGKVKFKAQAAGYKVVSREVTIPPEADANLEPITLLRPTGPGVLKGVALLRIGPEKTAPAPDVVVEVAGEKPVRTGPDGSFVFASVGPGPVTVTIKQRGYKPAEEVAAVPAAGEASVELVLEKLGTNELAAFRGQVRSTGGVAVQATLRIPEARVKTKTKVDGTFQVRLPAGRYTVVFEAEGFVSQSKTVEVAGGDQTLFYVDLTPSDR